MTEIPSDHPRYASLMARERLTEGLRMGWVAEAGLAAHGRGEAFDYLLGETTPPPARTAIRAAGAQLLVAKRPVLSLNGNVVALAREDIAGLLEALNRARQIVSADGLDRQARGGRTDEEAVEGAISQASRGMEHEAAVASQQSGPGDAQTSAHPLRHPAIAEVCLFHRTEARIIALVEAMAEVGVACLGRDPDAHIPGLSHARALCDSQGIGAADVVLVPLEDGDRAAALRAMGKRVITIDLNPLSRTARTAHITIVDELTRAVPLIAAEVEALAGVARGEVGDDEKAWRKMVDDFDNEDNLRATLNFMRERLGELSGME